MPESRLALARKLRGKTQAQLAREVNITQRAISKFEKEGKGLSPSKLCEIANQLSFDPSFFSGPDFEVPCKGCISFRARSKMSAKKRDQAIAASAFGLMLSDWMERRYVLPSVSLPDYSDYEPELAAYALRAEWGLGDNEPIFDMITVLELHGVRVFSIKEASQGIDAYSFWDEERGRPFVFLTTSKSGERRRMDAAHELGHLVLHRKVDLDISNSCDVEKQANTFASAFLMPRDGFCSKISRSISLTEIMRVKQLWRVSAFAVVYRAHTLGLLSDWQYGNLCVNMSRRGMRTSEPDCIVPERSQIAIKALDLAQKEYGERSAVSTAVGIPYSLITDLTFPPLSVVQCNGRVSAKRQHAERSCEFRLV